MVSRHHLIPSMPLTSSLQHRGWQRLSASQEQQSWWFCPHNSAATAFHITHADRQLGNTVCMETNIYASFAKSYFVLHIAGCFFEKEDAAELAD